MDSPFNVIFIECLLCVRILGSRNAEMNKAPNSLWSDEQCGEAHGGGQHIIIMYTAAHVYELQGEHTHDSVDRQAEDRPCQ